MSVNAITLFETGRHPLVPRLLGMVGQLIARFLAYLRQRADIAALHGMSDRELKDIGVHRCEIDCISRLARREAVDGALRAQPGSTLL